jgi:hypothetical protein
MTPEERALDAMRTKSLEGWLGLCSALSIAAGVVVLVGQSLAWLKSGYWPSLSIASALSWLGFEPNRLASTSWHGLNRVVMWFMDLHVSVGLLALGSLLGILIGQFAYEIARLKGRRTG